MEKIKLICLTPIKNEAWILKQFLESTSLWADHIIIADQGSDDGSLEIIKKFPKVILIENKSTTFNEPERQKMLINEARRIEGDKILIALDADESLTADSINNPEWQIIKNLKPGTIIRFTWVNLIPEKGIYWEILHKMPFGFIDNGSEHTGKIIHSDRVPTPHNSPEYFPKNIKVMHFQYADWKRMESKHRWYQCWEHIRDNKRSIIAIYRQYHHMYSIKKNNLKPIPHEWFEKYKNANINYNDIIINDFYYWDYEVINLLNKYGLKFFSRIDIWNINWVKIAKKSPNNKLISFNDPRTKFEKILMSYLEKTQPLMNNIFFKIIDRFTRIFF